MSNVTQVPIRPIKRAVIAWIVAGVLLAAAVGGWLAWRGTGQVVADKGSNEQFLAFNKRQPGVVETASGLQYKVLEPGAGAARPADTDIALIEYDGKLRDGTTFDASQRPTPFPVAGGIKGFTEGLKLMTKGAKHRLWIKPELGYGQQSPDPAKLPPGSLLVFDVRLVDFLPEAVVRQMQAQQQGMAPGGPGAGAPPPGLPPQ